MLGDVIVIALSVQAIHYTMREGEIFGWLGDFFFKHLPVALHKPVFDCPICMTFWYGSFIYLLMFGFQPGALPDWFLTVLGAMGLNVIISKLEKEEPLIEINQSNDTAGTSDDVSASL